jgi:glutamyl-tRNA synthetase
VNSVYLRRKSPGELADLAAPMLIESGVVAGGDLDKARLEDIMELLKERIALTTEIPDSVGYFYGGTLDYDEAEFEKQFGKEFVRENFPTLVERLGALPEWTETAIEEAVRGLAAEQEKGARHLIHPLRFAVTGRTVSAGLFETMQLLGRDRSLLRAEDVVKKMERLPA